MVLVAKISRPEVVSIVRGAFQVTEVGLPTPSQTKFFRRHIYNKRFARVPQLTFC